jgi:tryptophan synthase beta chain
MEVPYIAAGAEQRTPLPRAPVQRVAAAGGRRGVTFAVRASSNPAGGAKVSIPKQWYNLVADLPVKPPQPLHPQTHQPLSPGDLAPLFPDELIRQEVTEERFVDIPQEVIDVYELWRPTPLIRSFLQLTLC